MNKMYTITIECEKTALAELIATGLEQHARIVNLVEKEEPQPAPIVESEKPVKRVAASAVSFPQTIKASKPSKKGYQQKITCWEVYQMLVDQFSGSQREFTSGTARAALQKVSGKKLTSGSISAHIYRLTNMMLLKRHHDGKRHSYRIASHTVNKKKFETIQSLHR